MVELSFLAHAMRFEAVFENPSISSVSLKLETHLSAVSLLFAEGDLFLLRFLECSFSLVGDRVCLLIALEVLETKVGLTTWEL